MLTKLTLDNFKRHEHLVFDMTAGLNLITGPNYSGKSTLLQAIRYAFEGASAVPGGKAFLTRRGAKDHKVTLEMRVNESDYVVTRTNKSATLTRDGEEVAKSSSVVTTHLAELLGMSGQRFGQLRYGKQKETEALLTLGATELHKIVGEVSQVDIVNDVIAKCSAAATECNGGLKILPDIDLSDLKQRATYTKTSLTAQHTELERLVASIDTINNQVGQSEMALRELKDQAAAIDAANSERARLAEDYDKIQAGIKAAEERMKPVSGSDELLATLQAEQAKYTPLIAEATAKRQELASLLVQQAELLPRLNHSEEELARLRSMVTAHDPAVDLAPQRALVADDRKEHTLLTSQLADLKSAVASGVCPSCQRPYDNQGPEWLAQQQAEIASVSERLTFVDAALKKEEQNLQAWELSNQSLAKLEHRRDSMESTVEHQLVDADRLDAQIDPLQAEDWERALEDAQAAFNESQLAVDKTRDRAMALNTAKAELASFNNRLVEVTVKQKELGPVVPGLSLDTQLEALEGVKSIALELNSQYTPLSAEYTRLTGVLATLEAEILAGEKQAQQRAALSSRLAVSSKLAKYLRDNRDRFMGQVWGGIMGQASNFASACTGGAIEAVGRGEDGKFTYMEDGCPMPVAAASGAQRSIMGLGVQLAMAQMLPSPLSTIMLDEPGADMDAERSLSLTTLLAADNHQLLMISHREMDGAVADNTIALEA